MKGKTLKGIILILTMLALTSCTHPLKTDESGNQADKLSIYLWNVNLMDEYAPYIQSQFPDEEIEFVAGNNDLDFYEFLAKNNSLPDIITNRRFSLNDADELDEVLLDLSGTEEAASIHMIYLENYQNSDGTQRNLQESQKEDLTLKDFLSSFDFDYEVYQNDNHAEDALRKRLMEEGELDASLLNEPLIGLTDLQGANLGNIEGDRFPIDENLADRILSRMSIYVDEVVSEFVNAVENVGIDSSNLSLKSMYHICRGLGVEEVSYPMAEAIMNPESIVIPELHPGRSKSEVRLNNHPNVDIDR